MSRISRRDFLKLTGASALILSAGCRPAPPPLPPPATPLPTTPPTPAGPPVFSPVVPAPTELQLTPTADFYLTTHSSLVPALDPADWSLTFDGLVQQPLTLTFEQLIAWPALETTRTLECIGNPVGGPLIGAARWTGTLLKPILDTLGLQPASLRAKFTAADNYTTAVDLKWLLHPETLLAYEMNGEPLPPEHGYPVRLLIPGLYGQKQPKWLTRIEFIDTDYEGYWERQGWSDIASVRTNSIIRQPVALAALPAGLIPIFGVAFAGQRHITAVEIKIGDANWQPAQLLPGDADLVWMQWAFDWPAAPGEYKLSARATDDTGFTQSRTDLALLRDVFPNGTDKIHSILVKVV